MKTRLFFVLALLMLSSSLFSVIYPQAGFESYLGANRMTLLTPWFGVRVGISPQLSLLFKYYNHNLSYNYINGEETKIQRKAVLSNFTTALYVQKKSVYFFGAFSYFQGTDTYKALAFDGGIGAKIVGNLSAELGTYLIRESSILWHPAEAERYIFLYALKGGLQYKISKWLTVKTHVYFHQNEEDMKASSVMAGIVLTPKGPFIINIYYFKYSESADYRFSGDYLSMGLNFYY